MLGGIGSNLMSLLRMLTPQEVSKLTDEAVNHGTISSGDEVSVALDLNHSPKHQESFSGESNDTEAKILPFNKIAADEVKRQTDNMNAGQASEMLSKLSAKEKEEFILRSLNIKKKRKKVVGQDYNDDEDEIPKKEEEVSSTAFLLQEKAKIKQSRLKLVEQEALRSYRVQAAVDTAHEDKEDLTQSSSSGILINKRQF